jgi:hypothetical protein
VKTEEERYLRSVRKPGVRLAPAAAAAQWEAPGGGIVAESESLATAQTVSMGFQGLGSCLIFLFWLFYKIFFLQTYYRKLFSYLNLSTVRPCIEGHKEVSALGIKLDLGSHHLDTGLVTQ